VEAQKTLIELDHPLIEREIFLLLLIRRTKVEHHYVGNRHLVKVVDRILDHILVVLLRQGVYCQEIRERVILEQERYILKGNIHLPHKLGEQQQQRPPDPRILEGETV
jgi:hypothetical protein